MPTDPNYDPMADLSSLLRAGAGLANSIVESIPPETVEKVRSGLGTLPVTVQREAVKFILVNVVDGVLFADPAKGKPTPAPTPAPAPAEPTSEASPSPSDTSVEPPLLTPDGKFIWDRVSQNWIKLPE